MKRNYSWLTTVLVIAFALIHVAAMLKGDGNEVAIANTQSDPITYKQKVEELKDGIKGAPSPTFKYYGDEKILSQLPVNNEDSDDLETNYDHLPSYDDTLPENVTPDEPYEDDWWFKDWDDPLLDE